MAQTDSLRTHLVDELRDTLDAEQQLIKALPKMAKLASAPRLKQALQSHLAETRNQAQRVKQALRLLGESTRSKTCEGMQGLLEEGDEMASEAPAGPVRDAIIISAAQKVEHYEIASYGTAATFAEVLGERQVKRLLGATLNEEKSADMKLTTIAESSVNQRAAEAWASSQEEEESMLEQGTEWVSSAAKRASKALGLTGQRRTARGRKAGRRSASGRSASTRSASGRSRKGGRTRKGSSGGARKRTAKRSRKK
jgi:ferritin-like metal-binding protein YciE